MIFWFIPNSVSEIFIESSLVGINSDPKQGTFKDFCVCLLMVFFFFQPFFVCYFVDATNSNSNKNFKNRSSNNF